MKKIFLTMALSIGLMASAQVKIGANPTSINAASLLELESTTQGVLFPRVALTSTLTPTLAGGAHVAGMTVYNVGPATGDVTPGMYTNDGTKWILIAPAVGLYGKPTRVHPIASSITWLVDDVMILLLSTHSGNIDLPSASNNKNRIYGINNRSGAARMFSNQSGGDTGVYANEGLSQIANAATGWFISDGISYRVYAGRP